MSKNKDVDILILSKLSYEDLKTALLANKYFNSIYLDENFWLNRVISLIGKNNINLKRWNPKFASENENCEDKIDISRLRIFCWYFGLRNFRELEKYLHRFAKKWMFSVYSFNLKLIDSWVNQGYDLSFLPRYVIKDELKYYLRRETLEEVYCGFGYIDFLENTPVEKKKKNCRIPRYMFDI